MVINKKMRALICYRLSGFQGGIEKKPIKVGQNIFIMKTQNAF